MDGKQIRFLLQVLDLYSLILLSGEGTENNSSFKFQFGSITVKEIRDAIAKIKTKG